MQIQIRKPIGNGFKMMRLFFAFMFCMLATAFESSAGITLNTIVPDLSHPISVGFDSQQLQIVITNDGTQAETGIITTINQPAGMFIQAGSISVSIDNVALAASQYIVSGNTVTIIPALAGGSVARVFYNARANCSVLPTVLTTGGAIEIKDNISVTTNTSNESTTTSGYNVIYADLLLQTAAGSQSTQEVLWNSTVERIIPVTNGTGTGTTDKVTFSISYDDASMVTLLGGQIAKKGVGNWQALPAPTYDAYMQTYTFSIGASDFAAIGLGTSLNADEGFDFKEIVRIDKNKPHHTTNYFVGWGDSTSTCNLGRKTAMGTLYFTQSPVYTTMSTRMTFITKPTPCNRNGQIKVVYTNNGTAPLQAVLDMQLYVQITPEISITSITRNGLGVSYSSNGGSNAIIFDPTTNPDPDGVGTGLESLDHGSLYDDLKPGDSLVYIINYVSPDYFASKPDFYNYLYPYAYYYDISGIYRFAYDVQYDYNFTPQLTAVSPPDIVGGQASKLFTLSHNSEYTNFNVTQKSTVENNYVVKLTVPNGFMYDTSIPVTSGSSDVITASQVGDVITFTGIMQAGTISVALKENCPSLNGTQNLTWDFYNNYNNGSCSGLIPYGSTTSSVESHSGMCGSIGSTTGSSCFTIGTNPTFSVLRTTLGYSKAAHPANVWYESELSSVPKVTTAENPFLHKALVNDNVEITLNDTLFVNGCAPDTLVAMVYYDNASDVFDFTKVECIINGVSHTIPFPTVSVSGTRVSYRFAILPSMVGGSFTSGSIVMKATVKVREDAVGDCNTSVNLNYFRGYFYARLGSSSYNTDSYGDNITLYRNCPLSYNYNNYEINECGRTLDFYIYSPGGTSWGNEFRSATHNRDMTINLPSGVNYVAGSLTVYFNSQPLSGFTAVQVGSAINVYGIWPLQRATDDSYYLTYNVVPTCSAVQSYADVDITATIQDYCSPIPNTATYNSAFSRDYEIQPVAKKLSFVTEENQPGYSKSVSWRTYLDNPYYVDAPNTWIALEPNATNIAKIVFKRVVVNGTAINASQFIASGGKTYVNLGSIIAGSHNVIDIQGLYSNCGMNNVDTVMISGGTSCNAINSFANTCSVFTGRLTLTNKAADMQANIAEDIPDKIYDMCEPIAYTAVISSSSLGNMYDMGFWLSKPDNVLIVDNKVHYKYDTFEGDITDSLDIRNSRISTQIYPVGIEPGFPGLTNKNITVTFKAMVTCPKDSNFFDVGTSHSRLIINAKGITNCGDEKHYAPSFKFNMKGFEKIDSIKVATSGIDFATRHGKTTVNITVSNIAKSFIDDVWVETWLPKGVAYVANSSTLSGVSPTVTVDSGKTHLVWMLPKALHMAAGETLPFSIQVQDVSVCPPKNDCIITSSYLQRSFSGCGDTCVIKGTTDMDTLCLKPVYVSLLPPIQGRDTVCQAEQAVNYQVMAIPSLSISTWGITHDSDASVIQVKSDTSALYSFNKNSIGTVKVWYYGAVDGCADTVFKYVQINPVTKASLDISPSSLDGTAAPVTVTGGLPLGGVYSGQGITTSPTFDPSVAGYGIHIIDYIYTNAYGCKDTVSDTIEISCKPKFTIAASNACNGDTITVTFNTSTMKFDCGLESYVIVINTGGLIPIEGSGSVVGSINEQQDAFDMPYGDNYVIASDLFGTFYDGTGKLYSLKMLAPHAGSYAITFVDAFMDGGGLYPETVNTSVTVYPSPSVTINDIGFCKDEIGYLKPQTPAIGTYQWQKPDMVTLTADSIYADVQGIYAVTYTDTNTCKAIDTAFVTLYDLPTVEVKDTGFCVGGSVKVDATTSASVSYLWNTGETTASIVVSTQGMVSVTVTNGNGCTASDSAFVHERALPTVDLGDPIACAEEDFTITPVTSEVGPFAWNTPDGFVTASTITTQKAGMYSITVTNMYGCKASDSTTLKVLPKPKFTVVGDTVCQGSTARVPILSTAIQFKCGYESYVYAITIPQGLTVDSVSGAETFNQSDFGYVVDDTTLYVFADLFGTFFDGSGNIGTIYFKTANPGTFPVNITMAYFDGGGIIVDSINNGTVTVNPNPTITIDTKTICSGNSHSFVATSSEAGPYVWTLPDGSTTTSVDLTSDKAGLYQVSVTNSFGCSASDTALLNVNPIPTVSVNDISFCSDTKDTLKALVQPSDVTFAWNTGETTQNIVVSTSGMFTVTVTNSYNCMDTASAKVTVYDVPTVSVNDTSICKGFTATLNAKGQGTPSITYLWSTTAATQSIDVTTAGSYIVTVTDGNGCKNTDTAVVTIWENPTVTVNDTSICKGFTATLKAKGQGTPSITYLWSTTAATQSIDVTTAGSYIVTVTDGNGCKNADTAVVTIWEKPTVTVNDTSICKGFTATLKAKGLGTPSISYLWSTTAATQSIDVTTAGSYIVTVTDGNGCKNADTAVVIVWADPTVSIADVAVCKGTKATLVASAQGTPTILYLWSSAATTNSIDVTTAGSYTVTVTDGNGCKNSDTAVVTLYDLPIVHDTTITICFAKTASLDPGVYNHYLWDNASTIRTRGVTAEGTYTVTVTNVNSNNCSASAVATFDVRSKPTVSLKDTILCKSYDKGTETLALDADIYNQYSSYKWSTGATTHAITISVGNAAYIVTITSGNGCKTIDTSLVTEKWFWYGDMNNSIKSTTSNNQSPADWSADADIAKNILIHQGILPNLANINITIVPNIPASTGFTLSSDQSQNYKSVLLSPCFETQMDVDNVLGLNKGDYDLITRYAFTHTPWPILSQLKSDLDNPIPVSVTFANGALQFNAINPVYYFAINSITGVDELGELNDVSNSVDNQSFSDSTNKTYSWFSDVKAPFDNGTFMNIPVYGSIDDIVSMNVECNHQFYTLTVSIAKPPKGAGVHGLPAVHLYPNPATSSITIESSSVITAYEIVNILGVTVLNGRSAQNSVQIDVKGLLNQTYVVVVTTADGLKKQIQFIKQ